MRRMSGVWLSLGDRLISVAAIALGALRMVRVVGGVVAYIYSQASVVLRCPWWKMPSSLVKEYTASAVKGGECSIAMTGVYYALWWQSGTSGVRGLCLR